jgi:hypothetical protein
MAGAAAGSWCIFFPYDGVGPLCVEMFLGVLKKGRIDPGFFLANGQFNVKRNK